MFRGIKWDVGIITLPCGCNFPDDVTNQADERVESCCPDGKCYNRFQAKLCRDSWNLYKEYLRRWECQK